MRHCRKQRYVSAAWHEVLPFDPIFQVRAQVQVWHLHFHTVIPQTERPLSDPRYCERSVYILRQFLELL